jgi:hypothetical protein
MADKDDAARDAVEETGRAQPGAQKIPAAGPHAKADLTDKEKTPGAGTLPETDEGVVVPGSS